MTTDGVICAIWALAAAGTITYEKAIESEIELRKAAFQASFVDIDIVSVLKKRAEYQTTLQCYAAQEEADRA